MSSPDIPKMAPALTPDPKAASKAAAPAASPVMSPLAPDPDELDEVVMVVVFCPLEEVVVEVYFPEVVCPDEEDDFCPDEDDDDFCPEVVASAPDLLTAMVLLTWTSWSSPFWSIFLRSSSLMEERPSRFIALFDLSLED